MAKCTETESCGDVPNTWCSAPDCAYGRAKRAADTKESGTVQTRLRETTERMAHVANVDMTLWNEHSNAALTAADLLDAKDAEIERLTARVVQLEKLLSLMRPPEDIDLDKEMDSDD